MESDVVVESERTVKQSGNAFNGTGSGIPQSSDWNGSIKPDLTKDGEINKLVAELESQSGLVNSTNFICISDVINLL